ncbi:rhomboid family intramembrane serine protease [Nereida sp. MMG025]|uniref:rhomboid family intramembrane serine protease n=1 Tax=Nereida sp. MMG025 TaxID=2909981 RepID=UPI001F48A68E|nr:rhomboid family intramembrane serine protease [Nereida sp. MMG025]MCF6445089.1 rhomboid family intramembrane serine protease [Nereida sp. MMG025]
MFPIRDHNPSGRIPYVTYTLIALNIGVFIMYWPLLSDARAISSFFGDWAMIPGRVSAGEQSYTLVTSMFLHGGIMHLAGNMLFLWIFGDNMEDEFGHLGFTIFYLASGLAAGAAHLISDPSSGVPTVGASGAIAGVMGGYLLLFPKARVDILLILVVIFKIFPIPAWIMLGLWFGMQLLGGFSTPTTGGGVAYWAHAGGFVIGLIFTIPHFLRRGGIAFWQRTDMHPPHPEATYRFARTNVPTVRRK